MDVEMMQIEDVLTSFIEFFVKASRGFSQGAGAEAVSEAEIKQMEATLQGIKAIYIAQRTIEKLVEEVSRGDSGETGR